MVAVIFGRLILRRNRQQSLISVFHFWKPDQNPDVGHGPWFLSSRPLLSQAPDCGKNSPWALWPAREAHSPARGGPHFSQVLQTPLLPSSQPLMSVPLGPITPEKQLGMIDIPWEGVLGTSTSADALPCSFLLTFNYISLSSAVRPASWQDTELWLKPVIPCRHLLPWAFLAMGLGGNRHESDWQERPWESECAARHPLPFSSLSSTPPKHTRPLDGAIIKECEHI